MTPEEMVSRLIYRDGLMLVIDKPAGMAVHRGPKGGESLEDYFDALRFGLPRPPALAHRLDRDTSGCLVLGRHRKALADLGKLFKSGRVGKTYWAVVEGGPEADEGRIDLPLGRLDVTRGWWMKPDESGQPAVTVWKVLGRASRVPSLDCGGGVRRGQATDTGACDDPLPNRPPFRGRESPAASDDLVAAGSQKDNLNFTWLALEPLTGRTHQLRVHCAAMGWPIVGDAIYGNAPRTGAPALHLHAREIVVPISKNRDPVRVIAPVPPHLRERLRACGWIEGIAEGQ
jgi:tRNA pseudouridine32 synthase/23S rRNA pseudouridine746 synthase